MAIVIQVLVPDRERRPQRSARVARRRLNPDSLERSFTQNAAIPDTVECHAAGQAQILFTGLAVNVIRHAQHRQLNDFLNRPRQIHVTLRELRFRFAWWPVEQTIERGAGHGQALAVIEILHVEPERSVFVVTARISIGRQAHHFVLAGIYFESGVVGKSRVEQSEGVRKVKFAQQV